MPGKTSGKADVICCSQTPTEALVREWQENGIDRFPGSLPARSWAPRPNISRMPPRASMPTYHVLMIGDVPGDLKAARSVKALFYPIDPGDETESWKRFYEEALKRFSAGGYAGGYEAS